MNISAQKSKISSFHLQKATKLQKHQIFKEIYESLKTSRQEILKANEDDILNSSSYSSSLRDRLSINFDSLLSQITEIDSLEDPVGKVLLARELSEGLRLLNLLIITDYTKYPVLWELSW